MINYLKGKIIQRDLDSVTILTNGVGYKVFVTSEFLAETNNLDPEKSISLHTYLAVRESALDLYGFLTEDDKKLFKLLLTVSGIGPKSALNIMNSITKEMIEDSVQKEDAKYLSKISGIGRKTAEKIIIGLRDKIGTVGPQSGGSDNSVAIEALVSLGYSERDARDSIKKIKTKDKNTEEIIKEALNNIGKN